MEDTPQEKTPQDNAPQESAPQESAPQESAPQESVPQESAPQESAPQESAPQESAPQESAPQESAPQEGTPQESAPPPPQGDNKVLGIPADKYLKVCYVLVLISSGVGVLTGLLGLVGAPVSGGGLIVLLGLVGIVLAVLGWLVFSEDFAAMEISHLKYLSILFAGFYVVSIVFGSIFSGFLGYLMMTLIVIAQFICLLSGYKTWQGAQEATKDNLISGFNTLKSSVGL